MEFIVINIASVKSASLQILVIIGHHFLAAANAIINCRNGVTKLSFGNMRIELNIFNVFK